MGCLFSRTVALMLQCCVCRVSVCHHLYGMCCSYTRANVTTDTFDSHTGSRT